MGTTTASSEGAAIFKEEPENLLKNFHLTRLGLFLPSER
jgi:hypothetical protein